MAAAKNEAFIALQVRVTFESNLWRREWKFGGESLLVEGIFPGKGNEQIIG